ncbi:MAG: surface lipoprotein assembly modifier [Pseudomonadota bacterium]
MLRLSFRVFLAVACFNSATVKPVLAQDTETKLPAAEWSAELGVGVEYDSNISVEEVDASAEQGDYALILDAGVGVKKQLTPKTRSAFTYDFSQSIYDKFSQVDRQTHILGADFSVDMGRIDPGISAYYISSRLDNSKFLELTRVSPSLSGFISRKWFARLAYVYSDKTIADREGRDATTNAGEFDGYYFLRGLRQYFNIGYRYRDEDAKADEFDYRSNSVKLRYIQRFELFSRLTKLELAWRYEDRDYGSDTPSIGEKRHDERSRLRLDFEVPVFDNAAIQFFAGYADYESNFGPADYDQTIVGTRIFYSW